MLRVGILIGIFALWTGHATAKPIEIQWSGVARLTQVFNGTELWNFYSRLDIPLYKPINMSGRFTVEEDLDAGKSGYLEIYPVNDSDVGILSSLGYMPNNSLGYGNSLLVTNHGDPSLDDGLSLTQIFSITESESVGLAYTAFFWSGTGDTLDEGTGVVSVERLAGLLSSSRGDFAIGTPSRLYFTFDISDISFKMYRHDVPEPELAILMSLGLIGIGMARSHRRYSDT